MAPSAKKKLSFSKRSLHLLKYVFISLCRLICWEVINNPKKKSNNDQVTAHETTGGPKAFKL